MDKSGRRPLLMVNINYLKSFFINVKTIPITINCYYGFLQVSAAGTCLGCFLVGSSFLLQVLHLKNPYLTCVLVWVHFLIKRSSSQDLQLWKSSPFLALVGILVMQFHLFMRLPWMILYVTLFGSTWKLPCCFWLSSLLKIIQSTIYLSIAN